jgi:hypothetical protein
MEAHALFQHEVESHWLIGAMVLAPLTKGPGRQQPRRIDGIERMRLVRDDIADRVVDLLDRMQTRSS